VSDFGLARESDDNNYYSSKGGALPVRWTAPEVRTIRVARESGRSFCVQALESRKFSPATDVWAYGVLLYEIWTKAATPYAGKIDSCSRVLVVTSLMSRVRGLPGKTNQNVWIDIQSGYRLPCPAGCEKEVYDRMMHCWKDNPHERPTFRGLTIFFRKKSFAHGTIAPYEIAPILLRGATAALLEESSSRSAALIAEAVREANLGREGGNGHHIKGKKGKDKGAPKAKSNIPSRQPETAPVPWPHARASYVDLTGKVCAESEEKGHKAGLSTSSLLL
jgi:serine/threonine protein kinase